jgi:tetratricopeptide (TPR) repeat protein
MAAAVLLSTLVSLLGVCGNGPEEDLPATVTHVETWLARGDPEGARQELRDARGTLAPGWEPFLEARILIAEGEHADALPLLEQAYAERPDDPDVFDTLRAVQAVLGNAEEEGRLIEEYLRRNPDDERGLLASAVFYLDKKSPHYDAERGREYVERIHALRGEGRGSKGRSRVSDDRLRTVTSIADAATGRTGSGRDAARRQALASEAAEDYFRWADIARRDGKDPEALEAIGEAIRRDPDEMRYAAFRVKLYLEPASLGEGRQRELLAHSDALLKRWPEERDARVLRARALVRCEDVNPLGTARAKELYEQVLAASPDDLEALRNLAMLLWDWKSGEYRRDAATLLRRYVRLGGEIDDRMLDIWEKARKLDEGEDD